jgi:hypothetical protein
MQLGIHLFVLNIGVMALALEIVLFFLGIGLRTLKI